MISNIMANCIDSFGSILINKLDTVPKSKLDSSGFEAARLEFSMWEETAKITKQLSNIDVIVRKYETVTKEFEIFGNKLSNVKSFFKDFNSLDKFYKDSKDTHEIFCYGANRLIENPEDIDKQLGFLNVHFDHVSKDINMLNNMLFEFVKFLIKNTEYIKYDIFLHNVSK